MDYIIPYSHVMGQYKKEIGCIVIQSYFWTTNNNLPQNLLKNSDIDICYYILICAYIFFRCAMDLQRPVRLHSKVYGVAVLKNVCLLLDVYQIMWRYSDSQQLSYVHIQKDDFKKS